MSRRPPRATRTDTLFPYTTLFRSVLGKCGLIEDAMSLANTRVLHHDFDPTDASDALSFAPELIIVRDRDQRLVLAGQVRGDNVRSEEHTSELQSLMRNSYADFCLKKKNVSHPAH